MDKVKHTFAFEDLQIIYKSGTNSKRQQIVQKLHEVVHAVFCEPPNKGRVQMLMRAKNDERFVYKATPLGSDCVVMVDPFDSHHKITKEEKIAILGEGGLVIGEASKGPKEKVVGFHQEKSYKTWMEIFWHFHVTSCCLYSIGLAEILKAVMALGIKCVAFTKNEDHARVVRQILVDFTVKLSLDSESPLYLSRAELIENLGLEPDDEVPGSGSQPGGEGQGSGSQPQEEAVQLDPHMEDDEEDPEEKATIEEGEGEEEEGQPDESPNDDDDASPKKKPKRGVEDKEYASLFGDNKTPSPMKAMKVMKVMKNKPAPTAMKVMKVMKKKPAKS